MTFMRNTVEFLSTSSKAVQVATTWIVQRFPLGFFPSCKKESLRKLRPSFHEDVATWSPHLENLSELTH